MPRGHGCDSLRLRLAPQGDELLSAYLVRLAQAHGLSPTRFCAYHFTGMPVWTRDIDRSAPQTLLNAVANVSGLPIERVYAMTLQPLEALLSTGARRQGCGAGLSPIGVYHRRRRAYGLRYCGACLSEGQSFVRVWRVSEQVSCLHHLDALWDACTHCGAGVETHHQRRRLGTCHACHHLLGAGAGPLYLSREAQYWQQGLAQALCTGIVPFNGLSIPVGEWVAGLRLMQRLGGQNTRRAVGNAHCRRRHRAVMAEWTSVQLDDWPRTWLRTCETGRLTQRRLENAPVPPWLAPVIAHWPTGMSYAPRATRPASLEVRLQLLRQTRPPAWRTTHAYAVLGLATHR